MLSARKRRKKERERDRDRIREKERERGIGSEIKKERDGQKRSEIGCVEENRKS